MSSRNPTVSSSTTYSKKIKKIQPAVIPEKATLISEAPDFLRRLNIMRAPPKPAEHALPCSKTETEEIIAAMRETLMASPAPTPVVLPKKRKRPIYNIKQLAEKIAKHDHNEILDPKVEEIDEIPKETVPVPQANNKGKNLMNQVEVGLIKQSRLRRKRGNPSSIPEKVVPPKKAKIEVQEVNVKLAEESALSKNSKNQTQRKKKPKVLEKKTIGEIFVSRIQTRNRKKNFIKESSFIEAHSGNEDKAINNNKSSSVVDMESSQELSLSDCVPPKKTVKVNPFKPKARSRRKPGVFFGSRKKKRNLKTENKNQQPAPSKVDDTPLTEVIPKLEYSDPNPLVLEQTEKQVLQNCSEELQDITKIEFTSVQHIPQESPKSVQNEVSLKETVNEENKVAAPISADTPDSKEPEEVAEPRWHTQSDAFFDLPSTVSLGSILSSVNQAS